MLRHVGGVGKADMPGDKGSYICRSPFPLYALAVGSFGDRMVKRPQWWTGGGYSIANDKPGAGIFLVGELTVKKVQPSQHFLGGLFR